MSGVKDIAVQLGGKCLRGSRVYTSSISRNCSTGAVGTKVQKLPGFTGESALLRLLLLLLLLQ